MISKGIILILKRILIVKIKKLPLHPIKFTGDIMNIGTKIKVLRESNKLSQHELAKKLDISQGQLCKIESGMVEKIDFLLMNKICDLFNVDFQYFLNDTLSQTNQKNKNSAISIFGNPVVYNNLPEDAIESIVKNQEQIAKLIEMQNILLENFPNHQKPNNE